MFTLAHLHSLSLAHLPQQQQQQNKEFKLAMLYNESIADAHPIFLLEEAILSCPVLAFVDVLMKFIFMCIYLHISLIKGQLYGCPQ